MKDLKFVYLEKDESDNLNRIKKQLKDRGIKTTRARLLNFIIQKRSQNLSRQELLEFIYIELNRKFGSSDDVTQVNEHCSLIEK